MAVFSWASGKSFKDRITALEDTYVRFLWYQEISSGTSGTITPPTGGTIVLDQWAAGVDAVTSTIGGTGQRPSFESVKDASGNIITATLDGSGNWTISGTPSAYPIAICYVYDVKLSQADRTKSLEELETNQALKKTDSPTFVTVKCANLTDGFIPKHTSDAVGLENSSLSVSANGELTVTVNAANSLVLKLVGSHADATGNLKVLNDLGKEIDFKIDGSAVSGTSFGLSRASLARLYSYAATGLAIGTLDAVPLTLGTNNLAVLTITATKVLKLASGTAPSSSPADIAQLWVEDVGGAGQAELRVRDELGNVTTLSPHHVSLFVPAENVTLPWTHYHKNDLLGVEEEVDMGGLVKAVEELTGKQFSYIRNIPKTMLEDYLALREIDLRKKLREELSFEEEVSEADATELKEVEEIEIEIKNGKQIKVVESYKQSYVFEDGARVIRLEPVYKIKRVQKVVLREGVHLDETTGKFFIKRQPTQVMIDVELAKRPVNNLPKWLTDRIN